MLCVRHWGARRKFRLVVGRRDVWTCARPTLRRGSPRGRRQPTAPIRLDRDARWLAGSMATDRSPSSALVEDVVPRTSSMAAVGSFVAWAGVVVGGSEAAQRQSGGAHRETIDPIYGCLVPSLRMTLHSRRPRCGRMGMPIHSRRRPPIALGACRLAAGRRTPRRRGLRVGRALGDRGQRAAQSAPPARATGRRRRGRGARRARAGACRAVEVHRWITGEEMLAPWQRRAGYCRGRMLSWSRHLLVRLRQRQAGIASRQIQEAAERRSRRLTQPSALRPHAGPGRAARTSRRSASARPPRRPRSTLEIRSDVHLAPPACTAGCDASVSSWARRC